MGYYYDWVNQKWSDLDHDRVLTRKQRRLIEDRRVLIEDLLTEMEHGEEGLVCLYASLLAQALCLTDQELMMEFGKRAVGKDKEEREQERKRARSLAQKSGIEGKTA